MSGHICPYVCACRNPEVDIKYLTAPHTNTIIIFTILVTIVTETSSFTDPGAGYFQLDWLINGPPRICLCFLIGLGGLYPTFIEVLGEVFSGNLVKLLGQTWETRGFTGLPYSTGGG